MAEYIRSLTIPNYTKKEEIFNAASHEAGVYFSVAGLYFLLLKAVLYGASVRSFIAVGVYGVTMICLFLCSSLYHGASLGNYKKLLRVLDHSTVFLAVAGTYTPYLLIVVYEANPTEATELLFRMWTVAALGVMLNFLNMERLKHLLYAVCITSSIGMMVKIVIYSSLFYTECIKLSLMAGFFISIGVIMYCVGSRHKWFHSIFHIFVLMSCGIFYFAVLLYLI